MTLLWIFVLSALRFAGSLMCVLAALKCYYFLGKCAFIDGSYVNMSFRCNVGKYLFGNGKCATFAN